MTINFCILCGGTGSRLWPKSREKMPKQFLKLTNEYTMLQNTLLRVNKMISEEDNIYIIGNEEYSFIMDEQAKELNITGYKIITEPIGRDSAAAICIAALVGGEDDITMILPCDHIFDDEEFKKCFLEGMRYVRTNSLITFGIKPSRVETGYGYIKIIEDSITERFIEKPDYDLAKKYFKSGDYFWNAGVFLFKNSIIKDLYKKYANDIFEICEETFNNATISASNNFIKLKREYFENCRATSIDYAIMENICKESSTLSTSTTPRTIVYNSFWNDIGSFSALYDELEKDNSQNIIKGDVLTIDTNKCYIESSDNHLIATVGVNNLIVVNTTDALLICDKTRTQDVKKIMDTLKRTKREEAFYHKKVFRPWGFYENIHGNDYHGYKVKKISVYPGKRLSLQSHNHRSEHWVIVKGVGKMQLGEEFIEMHKDDHIHIPVKMLHRIENIGTELLEFTETQIGNYLGEDDIIRYEDDFGRK